MLVIRNLGQGTRRFTHLLRHIDGISQRMLRVTLRCLVRDGLVDRTMYPIVAPRGEHRLTALGRTLLRSLIALLDRRLIFAELQPETAKLPPRKGLAIDVLRKLDWDLATDERFRAERAVVHPAPFIPDPPMDRHDSVIGS